MFLSHVSVGIHPKLVLDSQQGVSEPSFVDKFLYTLEGFKKFCCVGKPNMRTATGVVNVHFTD